MATVSTTSAVTVELFADGGIRLYTPDGRIGLATLEAARDWVRAAADDGAPVHLRGALDTPLARPVVEEVRRLTTRVEAHPSTPIAWPKGRSSLQTAAYNGLVAQVADLLARGASPDVGRGRSTPYRLAMQRGHVDVLRVLRDGGATIPRGFQPPSVLPGGVVLRADPPGWIWWLFAPCIILTLLAGADGAYTVAPIFIALPIVAIVAIRLMLRNTACVIDGPLVARRRGWKWQGPVDLRTLHALGYTPPGSARMAVLWVLGQPGSGDRVNVYVKRGFDRSQRDAIRGLRFVPLYAAYGFMSPGFERLLAQYVDPSTVVIGPVAKSRVWPV